MTTRSFTVRVYVDAFAYGDVPTLLLDEATSRSLESRLYEMNSSFAQAYLIPSCIRPEIVTMV